VDWYQQFFVDTGRAAALWALVGFLVTFAVTRTITRRIRDKASQQRDGADPGRHRRGLGDVYIGGVHIHHQVWGILLVLSTGLLQIRYDPDPPAAEILAALFGAGAALTLDEFALWLDLDDVYWGAEGRKSIEAIMIAAAIGGVLLVQADPFGVSDDGDVHPGTWAYVIAIAVQLALAGACIVKGKLATGMIGAVLPLVGIVGAVRLAKPSSLWARRWYSERKLDRAQRRFGPAYQRRQDRIRDLLGGRPDQSRPTARS
jgi:hypothetical protein